MEFIPVEDTKAFQFNKEDTVFLYTDDELRIRNPVQATVFSIDESSENIHIQLSLTPAISIMPKKSIWKPDGAFRPETLKPHFISGVHLFYKKDGTFDHMQSNLHITGIGYTYQPPSKTTRSHKMRSRVGRRRGGNRTQKTKTKQQKNKQQKSNKKNK